MWPRDGALVANALSHAGYSDADALVLSFLRALDWRLWLSAAQIHAHRRLGSSWQPWVDAQNQPQFPIQEDETALVVYSLWQYYNLFRDVEYVRPLYIPAG